MSETSSGIWILDEDILDRADDVFGIAIQKYSDTVLQREFIFGKYEKFQLTPDKPNSFRKIVPVYHKRNEELESFATLYVIGFKLGDGTGDEGSYTKGDFTGADFLGFGLRNVESKHIPRKKTCDMEIFFPFFTMVNNATLGVEGISILYDVACLHELGIREYDNNNPTKRDIVRLCDLGVNFSKFCRYVSKFQSSDDGPKMQFTVANTRYGERKGDPHAIWFNEGLPDVIQVVGFMQPTKNMYDFFDKNAEMPEFKY